jgi:hypothetical protein
LLSGVLTVICCLSSDGGDGGDGDGKSLYCNTDDGDDGNDAFQIDKYQSRIFLNNVLIVCENHTQLECLKLEQAKEN